MLEPVFFYCVLLFFYQFMLEMRINNRGQFWYFKKKRRNDYSLHAILTMGKQRNFYVCHKLYVSLGSFSAAFLLHIGSILLFFFLVARSCMRRKYTNKIENLLTVNTIFICILFIHLRFFLFFSSFSKITIFYE